MTQEHSLTIEGHQLIAVEYNEHIDSIPVIFIHGIANSVYLWEPIQVPYVTQCLHWYSLSLPGHYPACLPDEFEPTELTPELMADIMSKAVAQLTGGRSALLVGYSTGGYASLCIAHEAPELVERMLLLDAFAKNIWGDGLRTQQIVANLKGIASTVLQPYLKVSTPSHMVTRFTYNMVGTDMKAMAAHPRFDDVVASNWSTVQAGNPMHIYPYFRHMFHQDISDWLLDIKTNSYILHGDRDRVIIPKHAKHMHKYLHNSQLQWIKGSGHLPFLERPRQFERYMTNWLQQ